MVVIESGACTRQRAHRGTWLRDIILHRSVWIADFALWMQDASHPPAASPSASGGHPIYVPAINTGRNKVVIMRGGSHWHAPTLKMSSCFKTISAFIQFPIIRKYCSLISIHLWRNMFSEDSLYYRFGRNLAYSE